jgi:hypothetical protein
MKPESLIENDYARLVKFMEAVEFSLKRQESAEAQAAGCRNALFVLSSGGPVAGVELFLESVRKI